MNIKGGYILQPRCIDQSEVMRLSPHVREIWFYLLRKANYKETEMFGKTIRRGQLYTTYSAIIEDLAWYVGFRKQSYSLDHCSTGLKALRKTGLITTTRTARGVIVTICNYDYYQDSKNYDNLTDSRTGSPNESRNENLPIYKEEKKEKQNKEYFIQIGEENFFVFGFYQSLLEEMLNDTWFLEQAICINMKLELPVVQEYIKKYFVKLTSEGRQTLLSLQDARQHFANWLRIELTKTNQQQKGENNEKTSRRNKRTSRYACSSSGTPQDYQKRF